LALIGWTYVAYEVFSTTPESLFAKVSTPALALETICLVEVGRIAIGDLPGNLVLGTILHAIRILTLTEIIPRNDEVWLAPAVLGSWAVTEMSRYPMYVFKTWKFARLLRMVVPVMTFPIGCGAEAYSAWLVFCLDGTPVYVKVGLVIVMGINGLLGPSMAYPVIVKKALKEVFGKSKKGDKMA